MRALMGWIWYLFRGSEDPSPRPRRDAVSAIAGVLIVLLGQLWVHFLLSHADIWGAWPDDSVWIPFVIDTSIRCVGFLPGCFIGGVVLGRFSSKRLAAACVLLLGVWIGLVAFGSLFYPDAFPVLRYVELHVVLLCQSAKWLFWIGGLLFGVLLGRAGKRGPRGDVFAGLRQEISRGGQQRLTGK